MTYKPMEDTLTPVLCEGCKRETQDISICSSGHVVCQNCISKCLSCYSDLCGHCMKKECDFCGLRVCKKCITKCSKCMKQMCKKHMARDYASGKEFCTNCLVQCRNCGNYTTSSRIKEGVCEKCSRLAGLRKKEE